MYSISLPTQEVREMGQRLEIEGCLLGFGIKIAGSLPLLGELAHLPNRIYRMKEVIVIFGQTAKLCCGYVVRAGCLVTFRLCDGTFQLRYCLRYNPHILAALPPVM